MPAAPDVRDLGVGARVGCYVIERTLAVTATSTVYRVRHAILPRRAALKVMRVPLRARAAETDAVFREACVLELLAHPDTVRIYECGVLPDRRPWMAMELIVGQLLSERLASTGPIGDAATIAVIGAVAAVLVRAHAGRLVHRDLSPAHILLLGPGATPLRVLDWGVALSAAERCVSDDDSGVVGNATYMAPEQARGLDLDGRCDVYALGVIAYEVLAGVPPFVGTSALAIMTQHLGAPVPALDAHRSDISDELSSLVTMMLTKERAQRPTAAHLVRWVDLLQAGVPHVDETPYVEVTLDPSQGRAETGEPPDRAQAPVAVGRSPVVPRGPRDAYAGELDTAADRSRR